ncbi:MAG: hypothetical protein M3Q29_23305 [Chloroflexota bacterium]|nr:hypothetical protein [Chloroflexota bacterium]
MVRVGAYYRMFRGSLEYSGDDRRVRVRGGGMLDDPELLRERVERMVQ